MTNQKPSSPELSTVPPSAVPPSRPARRRSAYGGRTTRCLASLRTGIIPLFTTALLLPLAFFGCEKPKPPPPPPPPKRAAAPPPPEKVVINGILQTLKPDARVQFPQDVAPTDETLARAVITFADALARGDADKIRPMLDPAGKTTLDTLVKNGGWGSSTGKAIEAVRVSSLAQGDQSTLVLAVQEPGVAYPLAWTIGNTSGSIVFTAAPAPNVTRSRASDFDDPSSLSEDASGAAAPEAPVMSLTKQVAAIFKRSCVECHGPEKHKGDLRLDNLSKLAAGTKDFPSAAALGAEILRRIALPEGDEDAMPKKGARLSTADIETLTKWMLSLATAATGTEGAGTPGTAPGKEAPPGTKKRNTPHGPVNVPSGPQPEQKPGG